MSDYVKTLHLFTPSLRRFLPAWSLAAAGLLAAMRYCAIRTPLLTETASSQ